MKKFAKKAALLATAAVMCVSATTSAFAAETIVEQNSPTSKVQQKITYTKTEAEIVPIFVVSVPDTVTLGKESQALDFSMNLEDHEDFIPEGKKVSVKISSAGYSGNLKKLAVWDSKHLQEAEYLIYNSDRAANPTYYNIGDEIASWEGSNWGTIQRRIKLTDYYSVAAGTYNGVINYSVSLEDAE